MEQHELIESGHGLKWQDVGLCGDAIPNLVSTLDECKKACLEMDGCNAIEFSDQGSPGWIFCNLWKCPTPAPSPPKSDPKVTGYIILNQGRQTELSSSQATEEAS